MEFDRWRPHESRLSAIPHFFCYVEVAVRLWNRDGRDPSKAACVKASRLFPLCCAMWKWLQPWFFLCCLGSSFLGTITCVVTAVSDKQGDGTYRFCCLAGCLRSWISCVFNRDLFMGRGKTGVVLTPVFL